MVNIRNCLANGLVAGALALVAFLPVRVAQAASEAVVYSFKNTGNDGRQPNGLISIGGSLYGTTSEGGANGGGTVFMVNPSTGAEMVVYSFCSQANCVDGSHPSAGLIGDNGILYGTTSQGGAGNNGTVFAVNRFTGAETVVYSFCSKASCVDGANPAAGLINVSGTLYGTTFWGGANNSGTVFGINSRFGVETSEYSFCSKTGCADGANPSAGVIHVGGAFYGTTSKGGVYDLNSGTVFEFNPTTGAETVVYSFCSKHCWDGADPTAGLIVAGGALYGTTLKGGAYGLNSGTVFRLNPNTRIFKEAHAFGSGADSAYPAAGLIDVSGTLVGTSYGGGANGVGTVFILIPRSGFETVLYSFQKNGSDGEFPTSGVINVSGSLYGTTSAGGTNGQGTVFKITLP